MSFLKPFIHPQWFPEINEHAPDTPIILVGTKLDLRSKPEAIQSLKENNQEPISTKMVIIFLFCVNAWIGRGIGKKGQRKTIFGMLGSHSRGFGQSLWRGCESHSLSKRQWRTVHESWQRKEERYQRQGKEGQGLRAPIITLRREQKTEPTCPLKYCNKPSYHSNSQVK